MAIGNSPSNPTTTTTNTTTQSSGVGGAVYGMVSNGNTGTINTSDMGALKAASDIALSGLQTTAAGSQAAASTVQDALNKVANLGSQTASGGLTTVIVPMLYVAGGVAALYFISKFFGKKG